MHFQALSVGIQVPTHHFSGTVHSVFRQACNIRLESHDLLTLLPSEKENLPRGIRVNTSSQPVFSDLLRVGQPIACRGGILRAGGTYFSIDLRSARPWHIDLQDLRIDLRRHVQAHSWAIAWSELRASRRRSGLSEILGIVSTHTILPLLRATRDLQLEEARASIKSLIGLGPGLTPSGDDFLVGYMAGLWATAGNNPLRMQFLAAFGAEISAAAHHTNEISRAYLRSAAKGHVSEPIAKLAQHLNRANDMKRVRAATQAALQVGHTSGTDGVLGLLLGCLAWQSPEPHLLNASPFFDGWVSPGMRRER